MPKNQHQAFSLVEVVIILTVIGLLLASMSAGAALIKMAGLNSARSFSKKSEINNISNMTLWLDATAKEAFLSESPANNSEIDQWRDVNQSISPQMLVNAAQTTAASRPTYVERGINNLPALKFDGSNDFFILANGRMVVQTDYTIFVVERRNAPVSSDRMFIGCHSENSNLRCLHIGYRNNTNIHFGHFQHDLSATNAVANDGGNSPPRFHSFVFSQTRGMNYFLNGRSIRVEATRTSPLQANNPAIGYYVTSNSYYSGFIGEIIIFSRALKNNDRQIVEQYLSKKWKIPLG